MKNKWHKPFLAAGLILIPILTAGAIQTHGPNKIDDYLVFQTPSKCPYVDSSTGLECLGVPMPNGVSVAGSKWKCTNGHTWIERD